MPSCASKLRSGCTSRAFERLGGRHCGRAFLFKWNAGRGTVKIVQPVKKLSFSPKIARHNGKCRTIWLATLLGLAALLLERPASAQARYFYLDRAQLSGAPDDGFMVWRPHMSDETRFYAMAGLGFTLNPLRDSAATDDPEIIREIDHLIQGQFISYLLVGTQIGKRASLNVSMPIQLYKFAGNDPAGAGVGAGGIDNAKVALHDMRFDLRIRVHETQKLKLGVGAAVWAPTGNSTGFAGDRAASTMLFGNGEYDLGPVFIAGMLGPHIRPDRSIGGSEGDLFLASELRYAFGVYYPWRPRWRFGVELWGSTGLENAGGRSTFLRTRNTDLEWLGQARYVLDKKERFYLNAGAGTRTIPGYGAPDLRILGTIGTFLTLKDFEPKTRVAGFRGTPTGDSYEKDTDGDGFPDAIDKCPTIKEDGKEPEPTDGCPLGADRDNDGILDANDQCPDDPEDKDGVRDGDGCPETDADSDGIVDKEDKCPTDFGTRKSARVGCPGDIEFDKESGIVRTLKPIQFEFGKANIKKVSFPILDEVATFMKEREEIRIAVHGHTDNVGADDINLRLSKARAASVMNYLVGKGIKKSRLESEGFGESTPIESNDTAEGRAKNRRVDFKILSE
jgi:outer membrane protein OmpA-like peptidoglycan-associated protein